MAYKNGHGWSERDVSCCELAPTLSFRDSDSKDAQTCWHAGAPGPWSDAI